MTTNIMLDLETWGTRPGCDIRSIGACVFDPVQGVLRSGTPAGSDTGTFYLATENPIVMPARPGHDGYFDRINAYRKYPLKRDPETVEWWSKQSAEAQAAFANPVDLHEACRLFGKWLRGDIAGDYYDIGEHDRKFPDNIVIWSNGPHFDVAILQAVFDAVGLPVPWHYRAPSDMRTIARAAGMRHDEFSNYGDAHNALHDSIAQAMTVCEAYKRLGLRK